MYVDGQAATTTMGFILSAEDRLLEHTREVRSRAKAAQKEAQSELEENLRLRRERFGPARAGSPFVRAAAAFSGPIGGPMPISSASLLVNNSLERNTATTTQQQQPQQQPDHLTDHSYQPGYDVDAEGEHIGASLDAASAAGSGGPGVVIDMQHASGEVGDDVGAIAAAWQGWNLIDVAEREESGMSSGDGVTGDEVVQEVD